MLTWYFGFFVLFSLTPRPSARLHAHRQQFVWASSKQERHTKASACSIVAMWMLLGLWFSSTSLQLYAQADGGSSLTGSVRSEQGGAVVGYVNVFRLDAREGLLVPQSECTALLDAGGKFTCTSVAPGFYAVLVYLLQCPSTNASPSRSTPGKGCPRFIPYPSNANDDPLSLVRVGSEDSLSLDIVVTNEHRYELRVQPANEDGIDRLNVSWEVGGASIPVEIDVSRSTDRQFILLGLPEATMQIIENWYLNESEHKAIAIVRTTQDVELNVSFTGRSSLLGNVRYSTRREQRAKEIACEEVSAVPPSRFAVPIDAEGAFSASDVPAGMYHCVLGGTEDVYIKSLSAGGISTDGAVLDLRSGGDIPLTVEAGISTARIAGSLRGLGGDGVPHMPGIAVRSEDSGIVQALRTDPAGRFQIQGLAPGMYKLYGWADIDKIPYRSLPFLRHYDHDATEISIGENTSTTDVEVECFDCNP